MLSKKSAKNSTQILFLFIAKRIKIVCTSRSKLLIFLVLFLALIAIFFVKLPFISCSLFLQTFFENYEELQWNGLCVSKDLLFFSWDKKAHKRPFSFFCERLKFSESQRQLLRNDAKDIYLDSLFNRNCFNLKVTIICKIAAFHKLKLYRWLIWQYFVGVFTHIEIRKIIYCIFICLKDF